MGATTIKARRTTNAAFDVARIRRDFPVLAQTVNEHPLAFLDSAASSQRPQSVIDTVRRYYERDHANVHRGIHTLSHRATEAFEGAREKVRNFINASSTREIVFTRGTTDSINLVASSFGGSFSAGDEIIISHLEHHSNSIAPFLRRTADGEVVIDLSTVEAQERLDLIKKIKQVVQTIRNRNGDEYTTVRTEIEPHDAKDAVVQMAKLRGMFKDFGGVAEEKEMTPERIAEFWERVGRIKTIHESLK